MFIQITLLSWPVGNFMGYYYITPYLRLPFWNVLAFIFPINLMQSSFRRIYLNASANKYLIALSLRFRNDLGLFLSLLEADLLGKSDCLGLQLLGRDELCMPQLLRSCPSSISSSFLYSRFDCLAAPAIFIDVHFLVNGGVWPNVLSAFGLQGRHALCGVTVDSAQLVLVLSFLLGLVEDILSPVDALGEVVLLNSLAWVAVLESSIAHVMVLIAEIFYIFDLAVEEVRATLRVLHVAARVTSRLS